MTRITPLCVETEWYNYAGGLVYRKTVCSLEPEVNGTLFPCWYKNGYTRNRSSVAQTEYDQKVEIYNVLGCLTFLFFIMYMCIRKTQTQTNTSNVELGIVEQRKEIYAQRYDIDFEGDSPEMQQVRSGKIVPFQHYPHDSERYKSTVTFNTECPDTCPICISPMQEYDIESGVGVRYPLNPCGHWFHADCVSRCETCPTCRAEFWCVK